MKDIKILFLILSISVNIIAFYPYIKDIFLGKTKPHTYTWLIWTLTQGTAVFGLLFGGGGYGVVAMVVSFVLVFTVFLFSLSKGFEKPNFSDKLFLILAFISILVWWKLNEPFISITLVSLIDLFGYIPSYRKIWLYPYSETITSWFLFTLGNVFMILSLKEYNFLTLVYLITITFCNLMLVSIFLIRRSNLKKVSVS
jgi:hypothetical protein